MILNPGRLRARGSPRQSRPRPLRPRRWCRRWASQPMPHRGAARSRRPGAPKGIGGARTGPEGARTGRRSTGAGRPRAVLANPADLDPSVHGGGVRRVRMQRSCGAQPDRLDALLRDAQGDQASLDEIGALEAEVVVEVLGAERVAVPFETSTASWSSIIALASALIPLSSRGSFDSVPNLATMVGTRAAAGNGRFGPSFVVGGGSGTTTTPPSPAPAGVSASQSGANSRLRSGRAAPPRGRARSGRVWECPPWTSTQNRRAPVRPREVSCKDALMRAATHGVSVLGAMLLSRHAGPPSPRPHRRCRRPRSPRRLPLLR